MYARATTIYPQPSSVEAGIEHLVSTTVPALEQMPGYVGISLFVDRDGSRCIATSSWHDEDALRASEGPARAVRDTATDAFGGTAEVSRWEIAALHREHPTGGEGGARVSWNRIAPPRIERAIEVYLDTALPALQEFDGFCSSSLLVDHAAGRAVCSVTYESVAAMERSRERAETLRAETMRAAGSEVLEVREFDVMLAHLRVPELI